MLQIEQQKAETKLQIEAERFNLDKEQRKRKLEAGRVNPDTKPNAVKLPKLDLNKFSGKLLKWQEFWNSFDPVVHFTELPIPVEKINYRRAKLQAETAVSSLRVNPDNFNYRESIRLLQKRFGQNEIIIIAH